MPRTPSKATLKNPKSRRALGKKGKHAKASEKKTVIDDPSFEDLTQLKQSGLEQFGQPKKTREAYQGYRKRAREFLAGHVEKRRANPDADGIDNDQLALAFEKTPNKYSAYAVEMFIAQKCLNEGNGISTAQGIHGAWCDEWDKADGTMYSGPYNYDKESEKVSGCPARAPGVTTLLKTIKNQGGQKGAAAVRHHAEAMLVEDMKQLRTWSNSTHPVSELQTSRAAPRLGAILSHAMMRAFLPTGFVLWTRNFETCKLQWRDITLNCAKGGNSFIRVHLENRKGWQRKNGWEGPLGTNTYHVYKQDLDEIDMYTHLLSWIGVLKGELGRELQDDDYIFPYISTNGTIHPKQSMSHEYVQTLLNEFSDGAGIERYYSTHCLRRGGAQYRMIYAPLEERWDIPRIRWWGGWAENESVDTLMKYLLDELQRYQCGHADALAPKPKSHEPHFLQANKIDYATKADIRAMQDTLVATIQGLTLNEPMAQLTLTNTTHTKAQLTAPLWPAAPSTSSGMVYCLASGSFGAPSVGSSYVPMMILNYPLQLPNMTAMPTQPFLGHSLPLWQPDSVLEPTATPLPAEKGSLTLTIEETAQSSDLTPIPAISRHPDLPRAGLRIPDLDRYNPNSWLEAVHQWEIGIPEENVPPLRDWELSWYQGSKRGHFAQKRRQRQLIAEEFYSLGRCEKMFLKLYGHCRGVTAMVNAIKLKKPDIKHRRSKHGTPEERNALL